MESGNMAWFENTEQKILYKMMILKNFFIECIFISQVRQYLERYKKKSCLSHQINISFNKETDHHGSLQLI